MGDYITHSITVKNTGTSTLPINVEEYYNGVLGDSTTLDNDVLVGQTKTIPLYSYAPKIAGQVTYTYKLYWDRTWPTSDVLLDTETKSVTITSTPSQPTTGSLYIISSPSGASVYVDGSYQGTTPIDNYVQSTGTHTVLISKSGYNDYSTSTTVNAGLTTSVTATLIQIYVPPSTGSLYITSSPSGASVYVDNIYQGITPTTVSSQTSGSHTIRISKSGYNDYITTAAVNARETIGVNGYLSEILANQPAAAAQPVYSQPDYVQPVTPRNTSSFDLSSLIILVIIGVVVVAGGYIVYSQMPRSKKAVLPLAPVSKSPKAKVSEPISDTIQNRAEQTILNQIKEIQNNPAVSSSTKTELNAIANSIHGINFTEYGYPLKTYAEEKLNSINNNFNRIERKGVVFKREPHDIGQLIDAEKYVEAIVESDKFLSDLARSEEVYDKASAYRAAMPDPEIVSLYNEGKYASVIKFYEEKQAKIDQVNKLRSTVKQLNENAEKVGSVPEYIKKNLLAQDVEILEKTINELESFIADAKPELTISLDRTQLSTERWHKLGITLTNTGLAHVENVAFAFSSEFETKGIKPISVKAGQSSRTDISIIPKNVGNILLEITLTYKDIKDREYKTVQEFWIDVVEKGTTTSPLSETPSSPVSQFTPRPLTQKQLPLDLVDRYTESEFIGKGGFARVFKARRKDGKYVAVKIPISMDATTGKSFIAEMQNWTKLSHPNIVRLYDFNIMPMPFFEEELCDGALSDQKKPIDSQEAAWILFNICEGLKFAHAQKIIHRDLKPQNILLKEGVPKISDWGLSRIISESTTTTATSFTPHYAAPEQINNRVKDERTDIWQLGVILYELVAGILPFKGDSMIEIGMNIVTKDPKHPGEIQIDAKAMEDVAMKCLQKDPAKRYQSVLELQKDLARYLRENYTELLKTSVSVQDYNRSAHYCGDLVLINMLTGDITTAYKYLLDIVHYSKGDVKVQAQELSEQIKMRMEMGLTEIPDELIQKAEIIVHQVSVGFKSMG